MRGNVGKEVAGLKKALRKALGEGAAAYVGLAAGNAFDPDTETALRAWQASVGAALATLAAAKHPPKALYTFGSPQVGNQAFVNSLPNIPIHRVVDDQDIVTTLPPVFVNFQHAGKEHKLPAPKKNFSLHHLFDPPKRLDDHTPINYVERVFNEAA